MNTNLTIQVARYTHLWRLVAKNLFSLAKYFFIQITVCIFMVIIIIIDITEHSKVCPYLLVPEKASTVMREALHLSTHIRVVCEYFDHENKI